MNKNFAGTHRGFDVFWQHGRNGIAVSVLSSIGGIRDLHVLADGPDDVMRLAKACIDFNYNQEAVSVDLGRNLTMQEICKLNRDGTQP